MKIKRKLKIAIFESTRIFPGGGQKVIPKIASYLSKKHEVEVFIQNVPKNRSEFGNAKLKFVSPKNRFLAPIAFLNIKIENKYDLIITGCFPSNFVLLRNSKVAPTIQIIHSPPRVFYDLKSHLLKSSNFLGKLKVHIKNILYKKLDYLSSRKVNRILAISEEIQKRVKKYYGKDSDIYYPGIDPQKFKEGKHEDYILAATRVVSAKRPKMILEAMKFVKNKEIKLIFVGSGEMSEEIKKMAKKETNVDFLGFVSEKKLKDLYSNCLAVIYIPINEDYGYIPIEAGASGKATIGSDEGGLKETIIDGKTGFLIKDIGPKKIAEKIDIFANDKKLAKKMGLQAKKYCEKFHFKKTFKSLDKAIEDLLG